MKVNVLEAKNRLSELIRSAQAGEDVVIANRGEPVVRLVPISKEDSVGPLGSPARILDWLRRNPLPEGSRRSREEIDADIQAERDAWD
jgi:prevent-host-death family protein